MTNPTSNYGWQMPTATDLVTDLPADFEVFGQAVDTSLVDLLGGTTGQVLKKNTNANMDFVWGTVAGDIEGVTAGVGITGGGTSGTVTITNDMATTITASGDIVVGTGSGTYDNLPIGTTNQVLTADTTVSPYKVKWASASAPATSYTLINTGGTALTGAATITITGLSGYNKLAIYVDGASAGSGAYFDYRFNSDTGNNYGAAGPRIIAQSTYDAGSFNTIKGPATYITFSENSGNAASVAHGLINVDAANSTGRKVITQRGGGNQSGGAVNNRMYIYGGFYDGTSVISSFSFISTDATNFDAGTIYIYGAN